MRRRFRRIVLALGCMAVAGCGGRGSVTSVEAESAHGFPQVQIPSMYEGEQRAAYAADHFWDRFLSTEHIYDSDSLTMNGVDIDEVEANLATYITLLESRGVESAGKSVDLLFTRLEGFQKADGGSDMLDRFSDLMEKYLYDPNSPYRDEDIYGSFVDRLAGSELTAPDMLPSLEYTARMCRLNRTGTQAADFRYVDINGRSHTLYGNKAEYTLLFFSNPGCEACMDIINTLQAMPEMAELISSGRLAVVNVYIDEDIDAWKAYQSHYPGSWSSGYDPDFTIRESVSYNVRAIPSLYLLDADKKVLMKDAPEEKVFRFLYELNQPHI